MLTLDALARMADRMPTELSEAPPFRQPDPALRVRRVDLPPLREEARRAVGHFAFFVGVAVVVLGITGVVVTHGAAVMSGAPPSATLLLGSALSFMGWTAAFTVPYAAIGLARELLRYREVRRRLGDRAWLEPHGWLRSEDGRVRLSLHA